MPALLRIFIIKTAITQGINSKISTSNIKAVREEACVNNEKTANFVINKLP